MLELLFAVSCFVFGMLGCWFSIGFWGVGSGFGAGMSGLFSKRLGIWLLDFRCLISATRPI